MRSFLEQSLSLQAKRYVKIANKRQNLVNIHVPIITKLI